MMDNFPRHHHAKLQSSLLITDKKALQFHLVMYPGGRFRIEIHQQAEVEDQHALKGDDPFRIINL